LGNDESPFQERKVCVVLGDLAEGPIEDRNLVLDPEPEIGVLVEGPLARRVDVGCFQGNRLVAVRVGELDPAVPIPVLYVRAAEDDKAGLEFLGIDKEGHGGTILCRICVFSAAKRLISLIWVGVVHEL
jgi:hypothetical protein